MMPKFTQILYPLLDFLKDNESQKIVNIWEKLREDYFPDLTEEEKEETKKSGTNRFYDRVHWAKTHLYKAGLLSSEGGGFFKITEEGKSFLEKNKTLELKDLYQYESFKEFKGRKTDGQSLEIKAEEIEEENSTPQDLINKGILELESKTKSDLSEKLKTVNPYYFETIVLKLLKKMGYGDFVETPKSRDGGIDGIMNQDKLGLEKIYIQAKRYNENDVRETDIRNFIGAMSGDTKKGVFVTTSKFHSDAIKKANNADQNIILIDKEKLIELMYQNGVGIQITENYEIKDIDNDFFEE